MGTSPENIDNAEDRHKFSAFLITLELINHAGQDFPPLRKFINLLKKLVFLLLIRPSYVLSGAAMNVVSNADQLEHFLEMATNVSKQHPVVVTEFIEQAKEIEIDAVANKGEMIAYAISEHVEFAGVHSGDATIVFPTAENLC